MRTYRRALLTVVAVAAALLQPASELTSLAQRQARTLHEQAKQAGGRLVTLYEPDRRIVYQNLGQLARRSEAVVIGRIRSHRSQLSPDGLAVTKDAKVRVQGIIKGGIPAGQTIQVRLSGGGYAFPDKTFAYVGPRNVRQAQENRLYVFFLKMTGAGYELVSETQALFALTGDGKVEPSEILDTIPLARQHKGQDAAAFLAELRRAVRNGKD